MVRGLRGFGFRILSKFKAVVFTVKAFKKFCVWAVLLATRQTQLH